MPTKNLDIKLRVDTSNADTNLKKTANDFKNLGNEGKKAADQTKAAWDRVSATAGKQGIIGRIFGGGARGGMSETVRQTSALTTALQGVGSAAASSGAAMATIAGAGALGSFQAMNKEIMSTSGNIVKLGNLIKGNEKDLLNAQHALKDSDMGVEFIKNMFGKEIQVNASWLQRATERLQQQYVQLGLNAEQAQKRISSVMSGKAPQELEKSIKATNDALKAQTSIGDKLGGVWNNIKTNWLAIVGVLASVKVAWDLAFFAEQAEQGKQAFMNMTTSMGINGEKLLSDLDRMSAGTISEFELIRKAGTSMMLGIKADALPQLMEIARATSRLTGQSIAEAFGDISLAVGRQSKMILDNLGIIVKLEEAYDNYAKKLGKSTSQLTEAEKKQAFLNETLIKGKDLVKRIGVETKTTAEYMQSFTSMWDKLKEIVGQAIVVIVKSITTLFTSIGIAWNFIFQQIARSFKRLLELMSKLPFVGNVFKPAADFAKSIEDHFAGAVDVSTEFLKNLWQIGQVSKQIPNMGPIGGDDGMSQEQIEKMKKKAEEIKQMMSDLAVERMKILGDEEEAEVMAAQEKYRRLRVEAEGNKAALASIAQTEGLEIAAIHKKYYDQTQKDFKELTDKIKKDAEAKKEFMALKAAQELDALGFPVQARLKELEAAYQKDLEAYKDYEEIKTQITNTYEAQRKKIMDDHAKEMYEKNKTALDKFAEEYKTTAQLIQQWTVSAAENFSSGLADAFWDAAEGIKSVKDAFKDFAYEFFKQISRMIMQQTILNALQGAAGFAGYGRGVGTSMPYIPARAGGGPVDKNRAYLVGEHGPELFVPGQSGLIKNKGFGSGGISVNTTVNMNGSSSGNQDDARKQGQMIADMVDAKVKQTLIEQQRTNGILRQRSM